MNVNGKPYRTVWMEGRTVHMINQPLLPHFFEIIQLADHKATAEAIRNMTVRGAGAIGVAGGYGVAQAALEAPEGAGFLAYVDAGAKLLAATRPTAQNLFYAIDRTMAALKAAPDETAARNAAVLEAQAMSDENADEGHRIGNHGATLLKDGARVLTHCNAGWLAFSDWGSALAPIYVAHRPGKKVFVFADETRPRGQGAQLTAWELGNEGVPHAIVADNASGFLMQRGEIDLAIVGRGPRGGERRRGEQDRHVREGRAWPTSWAFPSTWPRRPPPSTPTAPVGTTFPSRSAVRTRCCTPTACWTPGKFGRVRVAPAASTARNLAFDVTPARYITGIITENGIFEPEKILDALK